MRNSDRKKFVEWLKCGNKNLQKEAHRIEWLKCGNKNLQTWKLDQRNESRSVGRHRLNYQDRKKAVEQSG